MTAKIDKEINQCRGCQAGWPLIHNSYMYVNIYGSQLDYILGGYVGEKCICTKESYNRKNTNEKYM